MPEIDPLRDILPPISREDLRIISNDLSELQEVVSRGDYVVLAGGPVIAWWGVCVASGAFYNGLMSFGLPFFPVNILELLFGYVGASIISRMLKTHRILKPWRNQVISTSWWLTVLIIPLFIAGCIVRRVSDLWVMTGFECLVFAIVTCVSATASLRRWLLLPAAGWMISATLILFFTDERWRCFTFSLSCLAFLTVPGIILTRQFLRERR